MNQNYLFNSCVAGTNCTAAPPRRPRPRRRRLLRRRLRRRRLRRRLRRLHRRRHRRRRRRLHRRRRRRLHRRRRRRRRRRRFLRRRHRPAATAASATAAAPAAPPAAAAARRGRLLRITCRRRREDSTAEIAISAGTSARATTRSRRLRSASTPMTVLANPRPRLSSAGSGNSNRKVGDCSQPTFVASRDRPSARHQIVSRVTHAFRARANGAATRALSRSP